MENKQNKTSDRKIKIILFIVFLLIINGVAIFYNMTKESVGSVDTERGYILKDSLEQIKEISRKENDFYLKDDKIDEILKVYRFETPVLDDYFSKDLAYLQLFLPKENLYCLSLHSKQSEYNFKTYDYYIGESLVSNTAIYNNSQNDIDAYLSNTGEISNTDLGKTLKKMRDENEGLLKLYKNNDPVSFKKSIYSFNGGIGNDDILTMFFFEKNKLDRKTLDGYLNKCFDYKSKGTNTKLVKELFYSILEKK